MYDSLSRLSQTSKKQNLLNALRTVAMNRLESLFYFIRTVAMNRLESLFYFKCFSKKAKILSYSSVQLSGRAKP